MNRIKLLAVALVLLVVGAGVGTWLSQRDRPTTATADSNDASGTERKVLYWHDPMYPQARFDKPGKSPFMDMNLVPVYADEGSADSGVSVNPSVTQSLGIRVGKAELTPLQQRVDAVGDVAYDERLAEVVQARVSGYVSRLRARTMLEHVRRGQPLADIVAPEWLAAQQEYIAVLDATSERGRSIRDAARQRLVVLGVPENTIRAIEAGRKPDATTTVVAPVDGVITELGVREGSAFTSGTVLFRINGLKTVWANAAVPEAQVSSVPVGASVNLRATAWPGVTFGGRVDSLLPSVDPQSRTLTVRVVVDNPGGKLAPGMYVALEFVGPPDAAQLTVPSEAVIMTGRRNVVIVPRPGGGFDVREVKVGTEADGRTSILSGLEAGQPIVLSGQFLIDSEASLTAAVDRLETTAADAGATGSPSSQESPAAHSMHLGQGTVTAIDAQTVTIAHDPVPSLNWGAATMPFAVPTQGLPVGLAAGDRVTFAFFTTDEGGYQLDSIAKLDQRGSAGPAP